MPPTAAALTADPALAGRLALAVELDRLKGVERRTWRLDRSRRENSAEHSWHLAMLALVFAEHAPPGTDVDRAVRLCLVHDVVEIDAGDAFAFDEAAQLARPALEEAAAARLFGLLAPGPGRDELHALRAEFEAAATPAARYAHALDRLAPLLLNVHTDGGTWREHGVTRAAVLRRMAPIEHGAPALWPVVQRALELAAHEGWVSPDADPADGA
jgi:putative hydrolase of HD superfamily